MDLQTAINRYNEAWGEVDEDRRRALLRQSWARDAVYTDPTTVAEGAEHLVQLIGAVQQQFPGMSIVQSSEIEEHHNAFMFTWDLCMGGQTVISGRDFGIRGDDNTIHNLTCFYALPSAEEAEVEAATA